MFWKIFFLSNCCLICIYQWHCSSFWISLGRRQKTYHDTIVKPFSHNRVLPLHLKTHIKHVFHTHLKCCSLTQSDACNILKSTSCSLSVSVSLSRPWAGPRALSARLSRLHRLSLCCTLQLGQSSESCPAPARHQPSHCHWHAGPVPMQLRSSHSWHGWNHTQLIRSEGSHVVFFCDIFYHQKLLFTFHLHLS